MLNMIVNKFLLGEEKESAHEVIARITKDAVFEGTNLWILVFAIFIASLGLNVNSTAVIIGAMLISPLMGPIMGIGLGAAINDLALLKMAAKNFSFAVVVGLATSLVYFAISPLNDAYSELLARTTPTIYDVLIAIFGGLAGILATSSKQKGNVIPGVAIATALMPPLCTAGYGLATLNMRFFLGAFYLFSINTVFISLATYFTARLLRFPEKHLKDAKADAHAHRIIALVIILTVVPSIYFGYVMIQQNKFMRNAGRYIEAHANVVGNYLLDRKIDAHTKSITLVYGGQELSPDQISGLRGELGAYGLSGANLSIKQGISLLSDHRESDRLFQLTKALEDRDQTIRSLKASIDSVTAQRDLARRIYKELKIQYPGILSASISPSAEFSDSSSENVTLVVVRARGTVGEGQRRKISEWLKVRLESPNLRVMLTR